MKPSPASAHDCRQGRFRMPVLAQVGLRKKEPAVYRLDHLYRSLLHPDEARPQRLVTSDDSIECALESHLVEFALEAHRPRVVIRAARAPNCDMNHRRCCDGESGSEPL